MERREAHLLASQNAQEATRRTFLIICRRIFLDPKLTPDPFTATLKTPIEVPVAAKKSQWRRSLGDTLRAMPFWLEMCDRSVLFCFLLFYDILSLLTFKRSFILLWHRLLAYLYM
jgi:hypothetical protein